MKGNKFIKSIAVGGALLAMCVFALAACDNSAPPEYYVSYAVTFNSDGGSVVDTQTVGEGKCAKKPSDPAKKGFVFDYWMLADAEFDFETPITEDITLTAKWSKEISPLAAALENDYSNYTMTRTHREPEEAPDLIDTYTFKRTASASYHIVKMSSGRENDEYAMELDAGGNVIKGYYFSFSEQEWKKSTLSSFAEFNIVLDFSGFTETDFTESDGKYVLNEDDCASAAYQFFGLYNSDASDVWLTVKDGYIEKLGCMTSQGTLEIIQTLSDIGDTQITLPTVYNAVVITAGSKTVTEGDAIDVKTLFTITEEGRSVVVDDTMIDLGGLNAENPTVGEYTVTLNYTSEDNQSYSETAKVSVIEKKEETFADIFAKDYSNVTVTKGSAVYLCDDNIIYAGNNLYYVINANEYPTQYNASSGVTKENSKTAVPRIDLLTKLDASIFVYDETDQAYVAAKGEDEEKNAAIMSAIVKTIGSYVFQDTEDYSITIKVSGGYISEIVFSYSYKLTASAKNPMTKTETYVITEVGFTDLGEIPDGVLELAA